MDAAWEAGSCPEILRQGVTVEKDVTDFPGVFSSLLHPGFELTWYHLRLCLHSLLPPGPYGAVTPIGDYIK